MAISNAQIRRAAQKAGVPYWILQRQVGQESGGRQSAVSSAGARGVEQLMPGTARGLEQRYHLNTRTPYGNLLAGAYYLAEQYHTFHRWDYALAAYNAGPGAVRTHHGIPPYQQTEDYVRNILHGHDVSGSFGAGTPTDRGGGAPAAAGVAAPILTPEMVSQQGLAALASGHYNPTIGVQELIQSARQASMAVTKQTPGSLAPAAVVPPATGDWSKWVTLAKGADRPGMHTQQPVLQFVGQLGLRSGRRLTIGTGTQHDRMTVDGNVSAHWTGYAADIPSSGNQLLRLGRLALIQAGMPRRQAMKQKGGLYNVGGYQIIFLTNEGGNHYNHLHIGTRR